MESAASLIKSLFSAGDAYIAPWKWKSIRLLSSPSTACSVRVTVTATAQRPTYTTGWLLTCRCVQKKAINHRAGEC